MCAGTSFSVYVFFFEISVSTLLPYSIRIHPDVRKSSCTQLSSSYDNREETNDRL